MMSVSCHIPGWHVTCGSFPGKTFIKVKNWKYPCYLSNGKKRLPWSDLVRIYTLLQTNIAGWKIHHFDGMKPRKHGIFMGELLVSGRVGGDILPRFVGTIS